LLHSTSVNLIKRFAKLPDQAGAYIAWLNNLIVDIDTAIAEEPWQLIGSGSPPMLIRLKALLETLRLLAGESHERQEQPVKTWVSRGKQAQRNNTLRFVALSAKTAGEKRLALRKAEIERLAKETGIDADFHLRINPKAILPWPPADVLVLLFAPDLEGAAVMLAEQAELLRSLVESSTHMTVMPCIDGIAFPALARSGYQTLFPDVKGAVIWAEDLGLPCAPSTIASLFGEALGLAGELGAMDRKCLGTETRPEQEIIARRSLESTFATKKEELIRRLEISNPGLQTDVSDLIEHIRTGDVDFAAEAQLVIGSGASTEMMEEIGYLTLQLIDIER
ncbi:MAG: hypothetical protein WBM66_03230, partial [Thiothrix litoralis]